MTGPTALGPLSASPPLQNATPGANALTAPTTPAKRIAQVDKDRVDPQLRKAAEGMEAMFLDYLMKVMRQTVPKNEFDLENSATQIYRGMMDSENAQKVAKMGGVGLADQIIAYLQTDQYNERAGHGAPISTGGTHEGQPAR